MHEESRYSNLKKFKDEHAEEHKSVRESIDSLRKWCILAVISNLPQLLSFLQNL